MATAKSYLPWACNNALSHASPAAVLPMTAAAPRLVLLAAPPYASSCCRSAADLLLGPLRPLALSHSCSSCLALVRPPVALACSCSLSSQRPPLAPSIPSAPLHTPSSQGQSLSDCHSFLLSGVDSMAVSLLPLN
uniref:Uncharacterized protein n=1 Tax=Setaria viridis TaxID=4556 RepID=A0A4U6THD1_SETVI|nr:hypothetical protein SEVIR_8G113000v2 [Setaria viridis]